MTGPQKAEGQSEGRQPSGNGQPRGILKRVEEGGEGRSPQSVPIVAPSPPDVDDPASLTWDEPNLALNDLNRYAACWWDATRAGQPMQRLDHEDHGAEDAIRALMRLSASGSAEPESQVRYNPETDEVMNMDSQWPLWVRGPRRQALSCGSHAAIPDFNLGRSTSTESQAAPSASTSVRPPSRRSSESSEKRQVFVEKPDGQVGVTGPDGTDEEEPFMDNEAKMKHEAFVQARKGHYGYASQTAVLTRISPW